MKSLDELILRFQDIQDLPVSEEMLGAYVEGMLQGVELDATAEQISSESNLRELLNEAIDTNIENMVGTHPWDVYEGDYGYWELGLPPVLSPSDITSEDDKENIDDNSVDGDRILVEPPLYSQNTENSFSINTLKSNVMSNNSKTIIYGEKGENISDPVYVQQPDDHSCALRSQQIVLRDFGIDIPFKDLEQIALDNGVYTNEGTYTYDIGKVLQLAGVGMHQTEGNTIDDLINELAHGHRIIVSVDASELWYNNTMGEKLSNWFKDIINLQGGNHALIVAGVEVDPNHPENSKVILTDPGAGDLRIEYPMEQFKDAWGDSNCFMAATNEPAPYQYDAATGMEVPSNFAVQQYINDFVANNSYQLSPDMINIPDGYQPAFTGHLDMVGQVDFETFESTYQDILENRIPSSLTIKEQIEELAKTYAKEDPNPVGENTKPAGESTDSVGGNTGSAGETADPDKEDEEIKGEDDPYPVIIDLGPDGDSEEPSDEDNSNVESTENEDNDFDDEISH